MPLCTIIHHTATQLIVVQFTVVLYNITAGNQRFSRYSTKYNDCAAAAYSQIGAGRLQSAYALTQQTDTVDCFR